MFFNAGLDGYLIFAMQYMALADAIKSGNSSNFEAAINILTDSKGSWFYLDPANGRMTTGWLQLGETWYYLRPSGAMATGWFTQVGVWYYLRSSGAMATGWVKDGSSWYYMEASGVMVTGQKAINGQLEQFAANGVWYGYHAPAGYLQPTNHITSRKIGRASCRERV